MMMALADAQAVMDAARAAGTRQVRFLYCDSSGLLRGKVVPIEQLVARMQAGVGCTLAMQAVTVSDELVDIDGMGVVGEFRLIPDPATFTQLPYLPTTAAMLCDMRTPQLEMWGACPRSFLKRMIDRLQQHHVVARVGVEHECYLAQKVSREQAQEAGELAQQVGTSYVLPVGESPLFGMRVLDDSAHFFDALTSALKEQGIVPTLLYEEYGPGQIEIAIQHAEVLRAADAICLLREITHGVATMHGLLVSFAPKPFANLFAGNGAHLHLSLWGSEGSAYAGKNVFYDAGEPGHVSKTGRHFIGGVLEHIRGLVALTCGSVNSYMRLQPHAWSSAYSAWGFDNREGAIRVPSLLAGREEASMNLELRCADHSGNPYLALGGFIAAGIDGMERRIEPGAGLEVDPGSLDDAALAQQGIRRLPMSLDEALDALEGDRVLQEALGPLLATSYLAVKRQECAHFRDCSPEAIAGAHFLKY